MKLPIKLQDLLQQNESAICLWQQASLIAAASTFLSQKLAILDCTGIESLTPEQLALLFSSIPESWDLTEIEEVWDFSTVTTIFNHKLREWIHQRGSTIQLKSITNDEFKQNYLDIFNFRNEVIGDYRRYIESFLKIRDAKVKAFVDAELDKGQLWTQYPF